MTLTALAGLDTGFSRRTRTNPSSDSLKSEGARRGGQRRLRRPRGAGRPSQRFRYVAASRRFVRGADRCPPGVRIVTDLNARLERPLATGHVRQKFEDLSAWTKSPELMGGAFVNWSIKLLAPASRSGLEHLERRHHRRWPRRADGGGDAVRGRLPGHAVRAHGLAGAKIPARPGAAS